MPDLDDLKGSPLGGLILGAALASMAERKGDRPARPVLEDAEALRAAAERYGTANPFEPRQLVTPRADSDITDVGRPHIVLEVLDGARPIFVTASPKDVSSSGYGPRLDMRVASACSCGHGEIRAYWVESWKFEPWTPPAAIAAPAQPAPESATA